MSISEHLHTPIYGQWKITTIGNRNFVLPQSQIIIHFGFSRYINF
jgi:hypothetical protein